MLNLPYDLLPIVAVVALAVAGFLYVRGKAAKSAKHSAAHDAAPRHQPYGLDSLPAPLCDNCLSEEISSVPLQELDPGNPFSGDLVSCMKCGRLWWPPGYLDHDQCTYKALSAESRPSFGPPIFLSRHQTPEGDPFYECIIGRNCPDETAVSFIKHGLCFPLFAENTVNLKILKDQFAIAMDGLMEDDRDLWEIPEVGSLYFQIHEAVPEAGFWMTRESITRFYFTAALGLRIHHPNLAAVTVQHAELQEGAEPNAGSLALVENLLAKAYPQAFLWLNGRLPDDALTAHDIRDRSQLTQMFQAYQERQTG